MKVVLFFFGFLYSFSLAIAQTGDELYDKANDASINGNHVLSDSLINEYILNYPESSRGYYLRATNKFTRQLFIESIEDYLKAVDCDSQNWKAYSELGAAYLILDDLQTAVSVLSKAIEIEPNDVITLNSLAVAHFKNGSPVIAIEILNDALVADPDFVMTYSNLGTIKFFEGDTLGAVKDIITGLEKNPSDVKTMNTLGAIYGQVEEHGKAIEVFNRVISIDNKNAEAYIRRGISKFYIGMYRDALNDIEYGVELDTDFKNDAVIFIEKINEKLSTEN